MNKGNKAKKFIIIDQFTQPADLEYQTYVLWCKGEGYRLEQLRAHHKKQAQPNFFNEVP